MSWRAGRRVKKSLSARIMMGMGRSMCALTFCPGCFCSALDRYDAAICHSYASDTYNHLQTSKLRGIEPVQIPYFTVLDVRQ